MSNSIIDAEYKEWIRDVSQRFRRSQIKAAIKVNDEMLRFYWSLGKEMDTRKEMYQWGDHFYKQISKDLKDALQGIKSFSPRNLLYMHQFYRLYPDTVITPQVDAQLSEHENTPQVDARLLENSVFMIPWGHHKLIMDKCRDDLHKAQFYIHKTIENNWSRAVLLNFLDSDLYERQGKAVTNFALTLPERDSDLAQEITKDPYNFDFLTLTERYNEKEMKDALMDNAEKFFLELGRGFSYIGREVRMMVGKKEKFIDMLFFNYIAKCFVVLEIKAADFESSNTGQLGTYVVAVNHQMKEEWMNPTIGLLICKDKDEVEAQYALESSSQPLGISSYELSKIIPDQFKGTIPTIEEIETELER